jgi:hypothetical protein
LRVRCHCEDDHRDSQERADRHVSDDTLNASRRSAQEQADNREAVDVGTCAHGDPSPSAPAASALVLAQYGFEVVRVFHRLYASKRLWEPRSQPHRAGIASGNKRLRSIEDAGIPLSRRSLTFPVASIDSPYVLSARRLRDQNDDCDCYC